MTIDWFSPLIVFVVIMVFTLAFVHQNARWGYNMTTGVIFAAVTATIYGILRIYSLWKFDTSDWITVEIILFMYACPLAISIAGASVLMMGTRSPFCGKRE